MVGSACTSRPLHLDAREQPISHEVAADKDFRDLRDALCSATALRCKSRLHQSKRSYNCREKVAWLRNSPFPLEPLRRTRTWRPVL